MAEEATIDAQVAARLAAALVAGDIDATEFFKGLATFSDPPADPQPQGA